MSKFDVIALGELLIDFTCVSQDESGYPTMAAHPGGAPANFLAALNQYGAKVAMLGKIGDDTFGHLLLSTLRGSGINVEGIVVDSKVFTTLAFVTLSKDGDREFSFARKPGADTQLAFNEVKSELIRDTKVFHFGTLSLTTEPSREATYRACELAQSLDKLITFDPNLRKPLWNNLHDAKHEINWGLRHADVVKISDEEVAFLWSLSPEDGARKIIQEYGVKVVFVTCGANGCVFSNTHATGKVPSLPGIKVIDTTGAGDIFGGSAVSRILSLGKDPENLTEAELIDISCFASVAAGLSTTKAGGISSIPSYNEVIHHLHELQNI